METIYSMLEKFATQGDMDLEMSPELLELQQLMSTFNDHVKPYKNIQMIIGNERYVNELRTRIESFLKSKGLWEERDKKNPVLRKAVLFLIYNTDTDANEIIESSDNASHVVGNFPRITKCVLFFLIGSLNLTSYFYEFIVSAPSELVVQFLDSELLNSLKHVERYQLLETVSELIVASYKHCFLAYFSACKDSESREDDFEKIHDFVSTLFLSHVHVNRDKFPDLKKKLDFDTYVGHLLRLTLKAILECLESFVRLEIDPSVKETFALFQMNSDRKLGKSHSPDEFLVNYMSSLNTLILNRIEAVLLTVSCDTFMNWMEVDLSKTVTLQRAVGEIADRFHNFLEQHKEIDHAIRPALKAISVKPLLVSDIAKGTIIPEIIDHIEDKSNDDRGIWMKEFLGRGIFVLDNEECLSVIKESSDLLSVDDLKLITQFLRENIGGELENLSEIVDILSQVLSAEENPKAIEQFLETEEPFRVLLEYDFDPEKYFDSITEFLNKFVDHREEKLTHSFLRPIISGLVIDPEKTVKDIQNFCVADKNAVKNGIAILEPFKCFVSGYLEDILEDLLDTRLGEATTLKGLESYILGLFSGGYVNQERFQKTTLFPRILKCSHGGEEKADETLTLLRIFNGVLRVDSNRLSPDLRAPFVVGLGQVADEYRWDLLGYTDTKEKIVSLATELILFVGSSGDPLEGKHKAFVQQKSQSIKEMNRFYLQRIFPENENISLVQFLHGSTEFASDKNRRDFLLKTFPRATMSEKILLSDCNELQVHLIPMTLNVAKAIQGQEKLIPGFRGIFTAFLKITRERLIPISSSQDLNQFAEIVKLLPREIYEDQSFIVNEILVEILDKSSQDGDGEEMKALFLQKIKEFPESSGKAHLLEQCDKK